MEMQKPSKGGGAVTIYKRGQVPQTVEKAMGIKAQPGDIESGNSEAVVNVQEGEKNDIVEDVAKNETICKRTHSTDAFYRQTNSSSQSHGRTSRTQFPMENESASYSRMFRAT
jgi:hypothetical protein